MKLCQRSDGYNAMNGHSFSYGVHEDPSTSPFVGIVDFIQTGLYIGLQSFCSSGVDYENRNRFA